MQSNINRMHTIKWKEDELNSVTGYALTQQRTYSQGEHLLSKTEGSWANEFFLVILANN